MNFPLSRRFIIELYKDFRISHCTRTAASLSYSTLLSMVPLFMMVFWILSWFKIFHGIGAAIQQLIVTIFVADSAQALFTQLSLFITQLHSLRWTHLVVFAFTSMLMMYNMVCAYNNVWQVKIKRSLALSFIIYAAILLCTPIVFGLLLLLGPYIQSLHIVGSKTVQNTLQTPFLIMLPYISALVVFTLFNWIIPFIKVRFYYACIAGLFTTVLFEAAKGLFSLYLSYFNSYKVIYGALAIIPLFLVWMYVTWLVILLGVILCRNLQKSASPHL